MRKLEFAALAVALACGALGSCHRKVTSETGPAPAPSATPPLLEPESAELAAYHPEPDKPPAAGATQPSAPAPAPLSDAQIIKVLDVLDTAGAAEAKLAHRRARSGKVADFAARLVSFHGKSKERSLTLSSRLDLKPEQSPLATALWNDSETALAALKSTPVEDFDKYYIDARIEAYGKLLATLDREAIPQASDPRLKKLLQETRAKVEAHLERARQLQR